MKKLPIILFMIVVALVPAKPASGAEVNLRTKVGFNGYATPGTLTPVLIEINRTVANGRLEIVSVNEKGIGYIAESFPVGNSKRVEASVFVKQNINDLKIRLFSGRQVLFDTGLSSKTKLFPGNLILTVKAPASVQQSIEQALLPIEPVLAISTQVDNLPGTALNYDGVSGLVLSDPGSVLKPLQVQALKTWLSGGGRMALGAVRFGAESLLSMLEIDAENSEQHFYPIGFGGITVFRGGFSDLKLTESDWQNLLNLQPFTEVSRLRVNRIFPEFKEGGASDSAEISSKAASYLAIVIILWVISGLIIIIPLKNSRVFFLVCAALLWTISAFPIGNQLADLWNRGAEIHSHNIILPETGLMLSDVKIRFNQSNSGTMINFKSSPWGGKVFIGEINYGTVKPKSPAEIFVWTHNLNQAKTIVKNVGPGWVNINGWLPLKKNYLSGNKDEAGTIRKLSFETDTVLWDGQSFYRTEEYDAAGDWRETTNLPAWLRGEEEWLAKLSLFSPKTVWLIGRGPLSDLAVKIEKSVFTGEVWAAALPKGAPK